MSPVELKTELQQMIERETDVSVLKAIRTILQKASLDPVLKEKLACRALTSEADIQTGRLASKEDVVKRTK